MLIKHFGLVVLIFCTLTACNGSNSSSGNDTDYDFINGLCEQNTTADTSIEGNNTYVFQLSERKCIGSNKTNAQKKIIDVTLELDHPDLVLDTEARVFYETGTTVFYYNMSITNSSESNLCFVRLAGLIFNDGSGVELFSEELGFGYIDADLGQLGSGIATNTCLMAGNSIQFTGSDLVDPSSFSLDEIEELVITSMSALEEDEDDFPEPLEARTLSWNGFDTIYFDIGNTPESSIEIDGLTKLTLFDSEGYFVSFGFPFYADDSADDIYASNEVINFEGGIGYNGFQAVKVTASMEWDFYSALTAVSEGKMIDRLVSYEGLNRHEVQTRRSEMIYHLEQLHSSYH